MRENALHRRRAPSDDSPVAHLAEYSPFIPTSGPEALAFADTERISSPQIRDVNRPDPARTWPNLTTTSEARRLEAKILQLDEEPLSVLEDRLRFARHDLEQLAAHEIDILNALEPFDIKTDLLLRKQARLTERLEAARRDSHVHSGREADFGVDTIELEAERLLRNTDPAFRMMRIPTEQRSLHVETAYHTLSELRPELRKHADRMLRQYHDKLAQSQHISSQLDTVETELDRLSAETLPLKRAYKRTLDTKELLRRYIETITKRLEPARRAERRAKLPAATRNAIDDVSSAHWQLSNAEGAGDPLIHQLPAYTEFAREYLRHHDAFLNKILPLFRSPIPRAELEQTVQRFIQTHNITA